MMIADHVIMTFVYEDMRKLLTFKEHYCCGCFHCFGVNTLTGVQYWIDRNEPYSDPHSDKLSFHPQSSHGLRSLPAGRRHNSGYEYHQDADSILTRHSPHQTWGRTSDIWSCPQGFEPSNGICQGKLMSLSAVLYVSGRVTQVGHVKQLRPDIGESGLFGWQLSVRLITLYITRTNNEWKMDGLRKWLVIRTSLLLAVCSVH